MALQLGDYVKYTNRREKTDVTGTIIASVAQWWLVEIDSGIALNQGIQSFYPGSGETWLSIDHFTPKNPNMIHWGYNTKKTSIYVPKRSKNVRPGMLQYDPNQQGDTDDDI